MHDGPSPRADFRFSLRLSLLALQVSLPEVWQPTLLVNSVEEWLVEFFTEKDASQLVTLP